MSERSRSVLDAVEAAARGASSPWFPDLDGPAHVRLVRRQDRPRCFLYFAAVGDGVRERPILVKVRHSDPTLRRIDRYEAKRPVLTPERTLTDVDAARREYDGLQLISSAFTALDSARFGVLPVHAWIPQHGAIVMGLVPDPTLRQLLMARSRFRPLRWGRPDDDGRRWRNAGAWLRAYHGAPTDLPLEERTASRSAVLPLYERYCDFLSGPVGDRAFFARFADLAGQEAERSFPEALPLATGHGDFTPRNLFAHPAGRITGFDPMPLWRVPVYEDLARFIVSVRLLGLQAISLGLAFSSRMLDDIEAEVVRGYADAGGVPLAPLHAYQLLVLLDKWAALVSKQPRRAGPRQQVRRGRIELSNRYFRREAERLLGALGAVDDAVGTRRA